MWHSLWSRQRALLKCWMIALSVVLVSGCASTLSARVTSFQQWPPDAQGASYRIVAEPGQRNNLEFDAVADMVRASLGPVGLVEGHSSPNGNGKSDARFDIHIQYSNPATQTWVQRYPDPYLNDGWGFGPSFGFFNGGYRYWGGSVFYSPPIENVPVMVYKNTLTVVINDSKNNNAEVYRSTAVNLSSQENLLQAMPYLAQAVFDSFPGNNGQVREVEYPRQR
ncbi:DUF4136 domain-containing protein [Allopusillimonas ginsengisoli]|uniref:DUF4136 domain-containing protein n=1 Tax=Allopusillimonas ginsengisoli TaxID=453575 RepID=UPI00101F6AC5|nr:DUF4136 domain-containing protein [Allopusillimonas ginsengisoli]TEA78110.1 DUF4136 domain-containing protein [Allopusillimonas ginsengisoli]